MYMYIARITLYNKFNSSTVDTRSVVDMLERLALDNAAVYFAPDDAEVVAVDAEAEAVVGCKSTASTDASCKVEVLQCAVVFDCTRCSVDDPAPCFERENDCHPGDLSVLFAAVAYSWVVNWVDTTRDVPL